MATTMDLIAAHPSRTWGDDGKITPPLVARHREMALRLHREGVRPLAPGIVAKIRDARPIASPAPIPGRILRMADTKKLSAHWAAACRRANRNLIFEPIG